MTTNDSMMAPAIDTTADATTRMIDRAASTSNALVEKTAEGTKGALELGHNVVRAGLGAVGAVQEQTAKLFDSLVHRGARTEEKVVSDVKTQVADARQTVEARTQDVTSRVGDAVESTVAGPIGAAMRRVGVPTRGEVRELSNAVAVLAEKVDALIARMDAAPVVFAAEEAVIVTPEGTPATIVAPDGHTPAADAVAEAAAESKGTKGRR